MYKFILYKHAFTNTARANTTADSGAAPLAVFFTWGVARHVDGGELCSIMCGVSTIKLFHTFRLNTLDEKGPFAEVWCCVRYLVRCLVM